MIFKDGKYAGQKIADLWKKDGDKAYVAWSCKYENVRKFFEDPKRLEELKQYLNTARFKNPENYQAAYDLAKVSFQVEPVTDKGNLATDIAHEILGHLLPEIQALVNKPGEKAVSLPTYYSFTVNKLKSMTIDEIVLIMNELHNGNPEEIRKRHGLVVHRSEVHETFNTVTFK